MADIVIHDDDGVWQWGANIVATVQGPFTYVAGSGGSLASITYGGLTWYFAAYEAQSIDDSLLIEGDSRTYVHVLQECDQGGEAASPAAYALLFEDPHYGSRVEDGRDSGPFAFRTDSGWTARFYMATRQTIAIADNGVPIAGAVPTVVCQLRTALDGTVEYVWGGAAAQCYDLTGSGCTKNLPDGVIPPTDANGETSFVWPIGNGARGQWRQHRLYRFDPREPKVCILSAEVHYRDGDSVNDLHQIEAIEPSGSVSIDVRSCTVTVNGLDVGAFEDGVTVARHGLYVGHVEKDYQPTTYSDVNAGTYWCAGRGRDASGCFVRLPTSLDVEPGDSVTLTPAAKTYGQAAPPGELVYWELWLYDTDLNPLPGITIRSTAYHKITLEPLDVEDTTDANGYSFLTIDDDYARTAVFIQDADGAGFIYTNLLTFEYPFGVVVWRVGFLARTSKFANRPQPNLAIGLAGYDFRERDGDIATTAPYAGATPHGENRFEPVAVWDDADLGIPQNKRFNWRIYDTNDEDVTGIDVNIVQLGCGDSLYGGLQGIPYSAGLCGNVNALLPPEGEEEVPAQREVCQNWNVQFMGDQGDYWSLWLFALGIDDTPTEGLGAAFVQEHAHPYWITETWWRPDEGGYLRGHGYTTRRDCGVARDGRFFAGAGPMAAGFYRLKLVAVSTLCGYLERELTYWWSPGGHTLANPDIDGVVDNDDPYSAPGLILGTWNAGSFVAGTDLFTASTDWSPVARPKISCTVAPSSALVLRITGELADGSTEEVEITVSGTGESLIWSGNPVDADGEDSPYQDYHLWRRVNNVEWVSGPLEGVVQVLVLPPLLLLADGVRVWNEYSSLFMDRYRAGWGSVALCPAWSGGALYCIAVMEDGRLGAQVRPKPVRTEPWRSTDTFEEGAWTILDGNALIDDLDLDRTSRSEFVLTYRRNGEQIVGLSRDHLCSIRRLSRT